METHSWHEVYGLACKALGKWGVHVSNGLDWESCSHDKIYAFVSNKFHEMYNSETKIVEDNGVKKFVDSDFYKANDTFLNSGLITFDTKEEMEQYYSVFEQPLTASSAVYACTFGPDGHGITENT